MKKIITILATVVCLNINAQICFSPATNSPFATATQPASVCHADFNGDGKVDLAVADYFSNKVSILLGNGTGSFGAATNFSVGTHPYSVCSADFNGDGFADLASANYGSGNISVLLGNGSGSFSATSSFLVGSSPQCVINADFNGDGKVDLAVSNSNSGNVSILLGNGAGSFSTAANFLVDQNPFSVTIADFNGDSKVDLAVTNWGSNDVSVLLGDGAGSFGAALNFLVGYHPLGVASADFNGDGKADLAVGGGNIQILLGDGAGSFGTVTNFTVGGSPFIVTKADFNGDGFIDLATANQSNNTSVILGNGAGSFSAATNFAVGTNAYSVCSGDFNGDGKNDLAVANYGSNNISVLLNSPLPLVTANATATAICAGTAITLTGGGATSYVWSGGVTDGVAFVPGATTSYTVTGTDGNTCVNTATKTITVNPLPTVTANTSAPIVCIGTSVTLTGTGTATSYIWTGGVTDGVGFVPSSTITYTVTGTGGNSCVNTATKTITVNPLPIVTASATNNTVCAGSNVTLTGGGANSYLWTGGVTNAVPFVPSSTASYTVTGTDGNNCTNTATKTITVNPLPIVTANATSNTVCAGSNVTLTGGGAVSYIWTSGINNGVAFVPSSTASYTVIGTDGNSCSNSATITINVVIPATPDICMVSVDSATQYLNNIIYWDKTLYPSVDSFIVYREISTNVYNRIGAVSIDSVSLFIDTARNVGGPNGGHPDYGAYKYKIQIRDMCGNYGFKSPYHNTVFFQDQHNGNFNWNMYTIESQSVTPVGNFYLMRDNNNTNNYVAIGNVGGTQTSTSDPNYSTYQAQANWRVDATGFNCIPTMRLGNNSTQSTVVKSRSNVRNNRTTGSSQLAGGSRQVLVYPNPANNELTVLLNNNCNNCQIEIINVLGETVKNISVTNTENKINISEITNGVYFVKVISSGNSSLQKLIVQH